MLKKHTADDDSESQKRTDVQSPKVCVDYLSYAFDELDLAASWRVMTKQKKDIANGIRLENASWRTWAKQRNHLKTITPETLNWLKDSDVTWLYGPLHTVIKFKQEDRYSPKESNAHDKFGLIQASDPATLNDSGITGTPSTPTTVTRALPNVIPPIQSDTPCQQQQRPLKSALKKVTMADILRRSASEFLTGNNNNNEDNSSSGSTFSLSEANRQFGAFSPSLVATQRQLKLRFNQRVEQYMAISDDDGSSTNGSLPKVQTVSHLANRYGDDDAVFSSSSSSSDDGDDDHSKRHRLRNVNDSNGSDDKTCGTGKQLDRDRNEQLHQHASQNCLDDSNDDDNGSDNIGVITMHPHQSTQHDELQEGHTTSYSHFAPRSIKRIESTVLKSSSYSDTSRRSSVSSWDDGDDDDDDHDRRSSHLPDYYTAIDGNDSNSDNDNSNSNTREQSIQWEGQPYVAYDVAAPSFGPDSNFIDDDDWEIRQQSLDNISCIDDKVYDTQMEHCNNHSEVNGINSNDHSGMGSGSNNDSKTPMILENLPKPNPAALAPTASILSPGKASKSHPISEPSPIDALQHHHQQPTCNNTVDIALASSSVPYHERLIDHRQHSQQHPSTSVLENISQWASSYLRKS